jgi:hypothetical protein
MAENQRASNAKSGGMRIDDRKFFAGSGSPKFPKGVHTKDYSSAEGAGSEMDYEDTTEKIKAAQVEGVSKAKSKPMKPNYRN